MIPLTRVGRLVILKEHPLDHPNYCLYNEVGKVGSTPISYPEPSSFLLCMLDENEGLWKGLVLKVRK